MSGIGIGLGAKLLGVGGFLKRVPRPAWIALAIVLAVIAAVIWHGNKAGAAIAAAEKRGAAASDARWKASVARLHEQALALARKAEAISANISKQLKDQNDAEARNIADRADTLRVRGPGAAAACRGPGDNPGVPAGPGGHQPAGGGAGASGPQMPSGDRAAVPWPWLVDTGKRCDLNRAEVLTWRSWDKQQREAWERMRAAMPRPK